MKKLQQSKYTNLPQQGHEVERMPAALTQTLGKHSQERIILIG
jgi:hypothetical protein